MPCQVPSASAPPVTGTLSDTPVSMVLTCTGMSSGPSTSWIQGASSGARRSSAEMRSACTSGSAFSWMVSEAEVCRTNSSNTPSPAPAWAIKSAAWRVISVNPAPDVFKRNVTVAINCGVTSVIPNSRSAIVNSALAHHVFLEIDDHLDQALPGIFDSGAGARQIMTQLDGIILARRRQVCRRPRRRRLVQIGDLPFELRDFVLQPRDLLLERRAVFRHHLAGPADAVRTAERHLAADIVEAKEAVVDTVEGIAARRRRRR